MKESDNARVWTVELPGPGRARSSRAGHRLEDRLDARVTRPVNKKNPWLMTDCGVVGRRLTAVDPGVAPLGPMDRSRSGENCKQNVSGPKSGPDDRKIRTYGAGKPSGPDLAPTEQQLLADLGQTAGRTRAAL